MADTLIIDVDIEDGPKDTKRNGDGRSGNTRKRKRVTLTLENLTGREKEAHIEALQKELDGLFRYYKEVKEQQVSVELNKCGSRNAAIALLMEESELPLSRLIDEIYGKLKMVGSGAVHESVTYASVKSSVLFVGQRLMYGVPNADADVLEDDSESCLWCWETRDVKLIPKSVRGQFIVRRTCRRRIHERIMAVSEMIAALNKPESEHNFKHSLIKASEKIGKAYAESDIRLLVNGLLQKNSVDMAKKDAKREEKLLLKQLERNRREVENQNNSMHSELQKEILFSECDLKLLQEEARKDHQRCEKDGPEKRRQQRKQPDDAPKDQRRQEKEEAELRKKRSLQKQASIMERFLKRSKTSPSYLNEQLSTKAITSDSSTRKSEIVSEAATLSMDCTFASSREVNIEDICKSHFSSWHHLGHSIRSIRKQGWGLRRKPKTELFKELKLTATRAVAHSDELGVEKHVDEFGEHVDDRTCPVNVDISLSHSKKCHQKKQLLQFDKSCRPAYYGICLKKSHVVGPRHPFRKDPSLDYDISSDEEWEEEDPGESLSDYDKDEEESLEECSRSDGDESEDGFFVPDGYLSENEGAQVDRHIDIEGAGSSPSCKGIEGEEFFALLRQQKYLNNMTEQALRKNQPLIIPNLMHDKDHNLSGAPKLEQMCLQALSMRVIPGSSYIEISLDKMQDDQEACLSIGRVGLAPLSDMASIPDSDLPIIVTTIQTCSYGINKVLESLQLKFPAASKSSLKNKVCEISDYVDNHLQVKKEVLVKLGLALHHGME